MDRWLDGWKEGDCSASPAPSSEDLNNSGNPNTHFMQIASTRLQAEGSPLFSPPPAEEGRKQKPDPNPSPGNLVLGSSPVCEPRSQLPWALSTAEKLDIGRCCSLGACNSRRMRGAPLIRSVLAACNEGGLIGSSNMTQTPLWSSRTNAVDIGEPSSTVNEKMQQSENVAQQRYKRRCDSPRCSTKEIPLSHDCSRRSRREVDTSAFPKMKSPAGFLQSKDFAFDRQPPLSKWKRGDAERQKR